jgi:hypothetical protein
VYEYTTSQQTFLVRTSGQRHTFRHNPFLGWSKKEKYVNGQNMGQQAWSEIITVTVRIMLDKRTHDSVQLAHS